jgi:hypothetical protein
MALSAQKVTAYAGGIVGHPGQTTGQVLAIASCAALNPAISLEYTNADSALHRITSAKILMGNPLVAFTGNIAWSAMPLTANSAPFTEQAADTAATGLAGEDCAEKPAQSAYAALGWDFAAVWQMSGDYPTLR